MSVNLRVSLKNLFRMFVIICPQLRCPGRVHVLQFQASAPLSTSSCSYCHTAAHHIPVVPAWSANELKSYLWQVYKTMVAEAGD